MIDRPPPYLEVPHKAEKCDGISPHYQMTIGRTQVVKATICSGDNNAMNQSKLLSVLNCQMFTAVILKFRQLRSNLPETNSHSQLFRQPLNLARLALLKMYVFKLIKQLFKLRCKHKQIRASVSFPYKYNTPFKMAQCWSTLVNLATGDSLYKYLWGPGKVFEEDTLFGEAGWGGFGRWGVSPLSLVSACQGIHKSANTPEYNLNKYKTQSSQT